MSPIYKFNLFFSKDLSIAPTYLWGFMWYWTYKSLFFSVICSL